MPKYVNADKLIARMREIADEKWNKRAAPVCWSDAYGNFIDELEEADAEDVAPVRHGHWIRYTETDIKCSECRDVFVIPIGYDPIADCMVFYCPSCGAKMEEEEG